MAIRRSCQLRWYKKAAVSGTWATYIQAANEEEVHWMHMQDLTSVAHFADRYPGPYTVETLPLNFTLPGKTRKGRDEEEDAAQPGRESSPSREQTRCSG